MFHVVAVVARTVVRNRGLTALSYYRKKAAGDLAHGQGRTSEDSWERYALL